MIRLKVFISSVQKELATERTAIGGLLATDDFLRTTLVCIKGERAFPREAATAAFLAEIEADHHTYSRFNDEAGLLEAVRERLKEHVLVTYDIAPKPGQDAQARQNLQAASDFERKPVSGLSFADLDPGLATEMIAAAEDVDATRVAVADLPRLLHLPLRRKSGARRAQIRRKSGVFRRNRAQAGRKSNASRAKPRVPCPNCEAAGASIRSPKYETRLLNHDLSLNRYKEVVHDPVAHRPPAEILKTLGELEAEIQRGMKELEGMLK